MGHLDSSVVITPYLEGQHRSQVIALWDQVFGYEAPHNKPTLAIDKKVAVNDNLFFVAESGGHVVGTVMAGYDGHRGWIYSVAVVPGRRKQGIGSALVKFAEQALIKTGCVKINLQILEGNEGVIAFYSKLGFQVEKRVNMGKRVHENISGG